MITRESILRILVARATMLATSELPADWAQAKACLLAAALVVTMAGTAWAGAEGHKCRAISDVVGCLTIEQGKHLMALAAEGDYAAYDNYAVKSNCEQREKGEEGWIEGASIWHGLSCIRFQGETNCLWVPMNQIESSDAR